MKIILFDGSSLTANEIELGADALIVDGYRIIPMNEVIRIVA